LPKISSVLSASRTRLIRELQAFGDLPYPSAAWFKNAAPLAPFYWSIAAMVSSALPSNRLCRVPDYAAWLNFSHWLNGSCTTDAA